MKDRLCAALMTSFAALFIISPAIYPMSESKSRVPNKYYCISRTTLDKSIKRALDVLLAMLLLVFVAPLMALVTIAIKLDSRGPIFYQQERVGLDGRRFLLRKFRSMMHDAERDGRPLWASARDPRVTRLGRYIRYLRIDELPQLLNVLRGDMSLVGPRPERPYFVDRLSQIIPGYDRRHLVKPGITGWAQVNYPYGASIEDARQKLVYDLYYVDSGGLALDWKIWGMTVAVVLLGKGAR